MSSLGFSSRGASLGAVGQLLGLADRDPAQQGGQAGQPGQFLAALRAAAQVGVHHGALGRVNGAEYVDTERVPDVAAVRWAGHGASPRSSSASLSALSA